VMDKANELTKNGGTSYTYDANGNRLEETGANGTLTYAWDGRNRLSSISDGKGNAVAIHYDFERNMLGIDRTSGTAVANQSFLIDDATNIVSLTDAGGGISSILTGGSLGSHYAAVDSSGAVVFGSEDALGSTTAVTDSTGKPVAELNYEPFGQTTGTQSEGYPFGFIGRFPILGNVEYLQNRFFDAGVGRFLSEDPAGLQLGQDNLYRYAQNNPVQNADPTGLISGGVSYGGQAEIGDGNQGDGVAGQIGGGAGLFYNSNTGEWSVGGYGSGGGVIMSPDGPSFSAPDQAVPPFVFGASIAEPGLGGWISNADDPSDLRGTFCAFNVTVFDVSLSLQVGYSNGRMIAILSGSPGEGLSVSRYTTNTFATIGANPWAEGPIVFHGTYDAGQWHGAYEF